MGRQYNRIIAAISRTAWAIEPHKGADLWAFFRVKAAGIKLTSAEIEASIDAAAQAAPRSQRAGNVAVLRLNGVIMHRAEQVDDISGPGGTSSERFGARFDEVLRDDNVSAIVIDINSPGGAVSGTPELFAKILAARGQKPIIAVANAMAASAAYWIATAADEIVITPSGEVGSVGVWTAHDDLSEAFKMAGIKTTLIYAGQYKVEANPFEPLGEEARAALQASVQESYEMFTRDIARGRGRKVEDVIANFGQGRMVSADEAVRLGMADRVETLEATIARISGGSRAAGGRKAEAMRRRLALI
jgi:signal peptide peptidase SppA